LGTEAVCYNGEWGTKNWGGSQNPPGGLEKRHNEEQPEGDFYEESI